MRNILRKELKLSASPIVYIFILFGLMFLIPGYPILCGVFFTGLGLYKSFDLAREANDTVFSALLPIAKKDVVKGRYCFVCLIEFCTWILMAAVTIVRMSVLADSSVYRSNFMMNANPFALGAACVLFGLFNVIFVGGFYRTAYRTGKPFIIFMIVCFLAIGIFETLHHLPGLSALNAFGSDHLILQTGLLAAGIILYMIMTGFSCRRACDDFEKIDL